MILISVVIPTCNRGSYLDACLRSIRREAGTSGKLEIIVVDDGSRPSEAEQNRVSCINNGALYHLNAINQGMAVARNTGISLSQGEWLIFVDDDATVDNGWYAHLTEKLGTAGAGVVGFEGRVNPSGDGVWDREVSNRSGGAFLTCHLGVRRSVVDKCGLFDRGFSATGPFCEDHEFAARLLLFGEVPFFENVSVTHAPRTMRYVKLIASSMKRTRQLLRSDNYFYRRHPDRYHIFRSHRNFEGTLRSYLVKHVISTFRRRTLKSLVKHPFQSVVLLLATMLEQAAAWAMIPEFSNYKKDFPVTPFEGAIRLAEGAHGCSALPRVCGSFASRCMFRICNFPVYDILSVVKTCDGFDSGVPPGLYFRVDDLFFDRPEAVIKFCRVMQKHGQPYLAAVTGNDLLSENSMDFIKMIQDSNGVLALHGFTHEGKFGPFNSELLQVSFPDFTRKLDEVRNYLGRNNIAIEILVPPFNAIGPEQILGMSSMFKVICGGPETARFTGGVAVPFRIRNSGVYFPSFPPYYSKAGKLRGKWKILGAINPKIPVCLTTHFTDERKDSFRKLDSFLAQLHVSMQDWNRVY